LHFHLNLLDLGFKFLNLSIDLPESTAHVALSKLLVKGELFETLLTFPADLDNLRGISFDEPEELIKGVVCVANNENRSLWMPVRGEVNQHFHNLDTYVGLASARWTLNQC
jgi:hypothetical protein